MSTNIRKYILLTLSHAESGERSHYLPHFVSGKVRSLFNCQAVIVAKELHKNGGYHYHVGILNDTASRRIAAKQLRESFPEFEGRQLNVSFHKSWNTICEYIFKQDRDPYVWGTSKEECQERLHRKKTGQKGLDYVTRLRNCKTWNDVIKDDYLARIAMRSYSSVKQVYLDIKGVETQESLLSRLEEYLSLQESSGERVRAYSAEELKDRLAAMTWLGDNVAVDRPLRKPQLLLVGSPGSGKTTWVKNLSSFCRVYRIPARKDDFTKASTDVDFWVIDDLTADRMTPYILNHVLDGSDIDLDAKYGHMFEKRKNVPVIMACNVLPRFKYEEQLEAFRTRVTEVTFSKQDEELVAPRLAKTLYDQLKSRDVKRLARGSVLIEE